MGFTLINYGGNSLYLIYFHCSTVVVIATLTLYIELSNRTCRLQQTLVLKKSFFLLVDVVDI